MLVSITHNNHQYTSDLMRPIDISIPIKSGGVGAWNMPDVSISPVSLDGWIGDVEAGSAVNFNNILFNPHAHATHTECLGHITKDKESLNNELRQFFFIAKLISIMPKKHNKDCVITRSIIDQKLLKNENIDALVIRTLPNTENKISKNYSNTNPPFLLKSAAEHIANLNIKHLLIDLPSVDREKDEGKLSAHKAFWGLPAQKRNGSTITELIYVPNEVADGYYLLNLQFVPFQNDASPSRPLLFELQKK
ncbi:MAG: metal-dependent hydrolase [Flavobacteriales bacterium]|nr:metal-dependent hydrolase [Flavobacteriales bacterium]|tara:strand:+ start:12862 stop:13611 length:750 start_codon:yes stop_codon:yes gene_type:complete